MAEHTPGPWTWLNYPDGRKLLTGPNRAVIHCPGPGPQMGITNADQALIAAAPDLLATCKAAIAAYDQAYRGPSRAIWRGEDVDKMRAAIAQAEKGATDDRAHEGETEPGLSGIQFDPRR